jgi:uncharacterized protein (TIGR03435 family)
MLKGCARVNRIFRRMTKPTSYCVVGGLLLCLLTHTGHGYLQCQVSSDNNAPAFSFDVASIRDSSQSSPSLPMDENPLHSSSLRLENYTVVDMIMMAYGMDYRRIEGGPSWLHESRYMVVAKSDHAVDEKLASLNDDEAHSAKQRMLQELLADRFQLRVQKKTETGTIYVLTVLKKGANLISSPSIGEGKSDTSKVVSTPSIYGRGNWASGFELIGNGATMAMLATHLGKIADTKVMDNTGLAGRYSFKLKYGTGTSNDDSNMSNLREALSDQLGLKLVPAKGAIEALTIDHVEEPSPN